MNPNARILTGHRPTGPRHIGHLVGTLHTWAALQESHPCFFLVADLHVLTTQYETPAVIRQNTLEMVVDWLAAGIDPHHATLVLRLADPDGGQLRLPLVREVA
ncbi:MAG TPA: tryptophan--tRNA ligase, partial [Anaerolineaceae bacterium]|nr:tryptophan--tRNA ligase [Anaerolineaceae bacterium]